jgi:hypothetical protein
MTFAEYLQSLGASSDDVKALTEGSFAGTAKRAFDKLQADAASAAAEAKKQRDINVAYEAKVNEWFDKHDAEFKTVEQQVIAAKAKEAAAVAALRTAHERGMIDVAKDLGYNFDAPPNNTPPNNNAPLDSSKFVTADLFANKISEFSERAGDGLAVLQDIVLEHMQLFPNQPLKVRELRSAAVKANKSVEQYWLETFKVDEARAAMAKRASDAHEAELRKKITEEVTSEFASKYGNPDVRPLQPSTNFLTPRKETNRDKAPWETGLEGEGGSNDRVRRATQNALKAQSGVH